MLEEERERNKEMNELLKCRVEDLEAELARTRCRLGKKVPLNIKCTNASDNEPVSTPC